MVEILKPVADEPTQSSKQPAGPNAAPHLTRISFEAATHRMDGQIWTKNVNKNPITCVSTKEVDAGFADNRTPVWRQWVTKRFKIQHQLTQQIVYAPRFSRATVVSGRLNLKSTARMPCSCPDSCQRSARSANRIQIIQ
jgi:hypothetical protein